MELGLHKTDCFRTVAFVEIDKNCKKVLNKNFPEIPVFNDINSLYFNHYGLTDMDNSFVVKENIDVVCGGFPCQDISIGGARKGILNGKRSNLWKQFSRIISETRPKWVIIENVEYLRKNGLGIVLNDLRRIGYDAEWYCLTAAGTSGHPHQRKRLFIISYPSSQRFDKCIREARYIHFNSEWPNSQTYQEWKECQFESQSFCQILSRRAVEGFKNSKTDQSSIVSTFRRVTNGLPNKLDENRRKQRIKQLGNAIMPSMAELIGTQIARIELIKNQLEIRYGTK